MEKSRALMEIAEARRCIAGRLAPRPAVMLPLAEACGRVTSEPLRAVMDAPAFDQSTMDGYAMASADAGPHPLPVDQSLSTRMEGIPRGTLRVATGQPVPGWAHCVVPQEQCSIDADGLRISDDTSLATGQFIRRRGSSFRAGNEVLPAGTILTPGAVALAASCGCTELPVRRPVDALHIATGSELIAPPALPVGWQIYDSNGPMIAALLLERDIPCRGEKTGDSPSTLLHVISEFMGDLILVSGGSGPGEQDHTATAFEDSGFEIHISGVNSRPGKPLIFATRGHQAAFGLPGNPLSQWVCFQVFVRVALAAWNGLPAAELIAADCDRGESWECSGGDGRPTWTPARAAHDQGRIHVHPLPWQHSADLLPLASANALTFGAPDSQTGRIPVLITHHNPSPL